MVVWGVETKTTLYSMMNTKLNGTFINVKQYEIKAIVFPLFLKQPIRILLWKQRNAFWYKPFA